MTLPTTEKSILQWGIRLLQTHLVSYVSALSSATTLARAGPASARTAWCGTARDTHATGPTTDSQGNKKKNEQIEIHTKISSNILWREIKNWPAPARIAWCGAAKVIPATGPTTDSQGKK